MLNYLNLNEPNFIFMFRDPNDIKRTATSLSWYPDGTQKLAVSYSILEFQKSSGDTCMDSYIWDIGKPLPPLSLPLIDCSLSDTGSPNQRTGCKKHC